MKRWLSIIIAFVAGAGVASLAWGWYLVKFQIEVAATHTSVLSFQEDVGEQVLNYIDSPNPLKARRLEFAASNMVACFSSDVATWDREFPYMRLQKRWRPRIERAESFLRQRQTAASTNSASGHE